MVIRKAIHEHGTAGCLHSPEAGETQRHMLQDIHHTTLPHPTAGAPVLPPVPLEEQALCGCQYHGGGRALRVVLWGEVGWGVGETGGGRGQRGFFLEEGILCGLRLEVVCSVQLNELVVICSNRMFQYLHGSILYTP